MQITNFPKVTVILRGYTYEQVRAVAKNLVGTKLNAIEITMNSPDVLETIRKITEEFGESLYVGAGTIRTMEEAKQAISVGARFLLSPIMLSEEILNYCKENDVISVPAAFSPSEVQKMVDLGADIIKIFPASCLGSKYFSDIQAPLGKIPLMAVGGIHGSNVQEYLNAGASFVGIASGIFQKEHIQQCQEEELKKAIQNFEAKVVW
ncbi:MAG: bifunctional 4-hydroxy-2-oxoglutarate aldolase/2-dehydro-3-deoxy-phosphogluconate aldolase [Firmicutes bacterium]|uniref:Bifunctional 4-hydroxy-2-oxoglutarate aldolase/2-dehydro-3-deoxy-phosphogluconate aldolase n=1 Tax=Candidatus Scybalomonas excrementavium TaxID=2840943 RepID=A0A9D9HZE3_9FIRM|nr:bifunctional 4-hydroxy-2-oxoglutarate aldolase/2-dehydro-3-deoxy-phosphogluconate aldolase [Candidatus Scybalomonas excrementavium]